LQSTTGLIDFSNVHWYRSTRILEVFSFVCH